jgi:hypothetical protein
MKKKFNCISCNTEYSLQWDEDKADDPEYCPFCTDPIDYDIDPLDFNECESSE